jgi:hypothetical protein
MLFALMVRFGIGCKTDVLHVVLVVFLMEFNINVIRVVLGHTLIPLKMPIVKTVLLVLLVQPLVQVVVVYVVLDQSLH